jgi:urease
LCAGAELDKLILTSAGLLAQRRLHRGLKLNLTEATALISVVTLEWIRDGDKSVSYIMNEARSILGLSDVMPGVSSLISEIQIEANFPDGTKLVTIHTPVVNLFGNSAYALYGSCLSSTGESTPSNKEMLSFQKTPSNTQRNVHSSSAHSPSNPAATASTNTTASEITNSFESSVAIRRSSISDQIMTVRRTSIDKTSHTVCVGVADDADYIPGAIIPAKLPPILINQGRSCIELTVTNLNDRPIQVGSHYNFTEVNKKLQFDRIAAVGRRLNIPSGTAVRFEPGEKKTVQLVKIGGKAIVRGGNNLINGPAVTERSAEILQRIKEKGFAHAPAHNIAEEIIGSEKSRLNRSIPRSKYIQLYGPTVGDRIRLADTGLVAEIERDLIAGFAGDELKFGGGKTLREGQGQGTGIPEKVALDTVITNAVIIDFSGIYKADIGVKNGKIVGIGKAGNPDIMDGVSPEMIVGVTTEAIDASGLIITAGGIDSHVHFICPQLIFEGLSSGVTTFIGGGTGPSTSTLATTCTPAAAHYSAMLKATDQFPVNIGLTGKANTADSTGLIEQIAAGAIGLKLHEDWGSSPAAIETALSVADAEEVQITIHTDTLNESASVEDTVEAFRGRAIHAYHVEGAGGGHAPDIISVCSHNNVIPSSTNPTRPLTVNTIDEHLDMLMCCHHLDKNLPEDIAFAESRIRQETIEAEDILHDLGAIPIINSDSMAMGRAGEVIIRCWQTAAKMKVERGHLADTEGPEQKLGENSPQISAENDNFRIRRYIAKYTINPAISHGVDELIGSVEVGKLADLVLWKPATFGIKPALIIKAGIIVEAPMGDANASIATCQPMLSRPMFGAFGAAAASVGVVFVSRRSLDVAAAGLVPSFNLQKKPYAVRNLRKKFKQDMKLNCAQPKISVDPETFKVFADGNLLTCKAASRLPLTQLYKLF